MDSNRELGASTLIQHLGEEDKYFGSVVPPIVHNSLFTFEDADAWEEAMGTPGKQPPFVYSRNGNPTVEIAEKKIAALEGSEDAKLVQGGAAALAVAMMDALQQGSHAVIVETAYGTSRWVAQNLFASFGAEVTLVDGRDPQEVIDALRTNTSLVVLESPSSCIFYLQDLEAITATTRERGITTVLDNTYSTPLFQSPLKMGIDVVVHSCSKYLGGHSDIIAGVLCADAARIQRYQNIISHIGSVLSPFPAWLLIRGMRTLEVRLKRHQQTALDIAQWLETLPMVEEVRHPALPSFDQNGLYKKQMRGTGGLFTVMLDTVDYGRAKKFVNSLLIFQRGVSWGGFESLALPMKFNLIGYQRERIGVRLFCGLEDADDLKEDIDQAMKSAFR